MHVYVRFTKLKSYDLRPIGKPRVSPLLSFNTSSVIRYLICVYASHFFAGRPYHFNQTLRTANKFYNDDNRWVLEKYWSLMKVRNQPKLRRVDLRLATSNISYNGGNKIYCIINSSETEYINNHILNVLKYIFNM